MGTSSIYNGPKGVKKANLGHSNSQENSSTGTLYNISWGSMKTSMSKFVSGNYSNRSGIISKYVKVLGGKSGATRQSSSGVISSTNLGKLLSSIQSQGVQKTLEDLNIDFKNKSVEQLFSEMVNIISYNANSKENIIARNATIKALSELYEFIERNGMELSALDKIDDTLFDEVMIIHISSYILEKLLNDLQSRFEKFSSDSEAALLKEKECQEYIYSVVSVKLKDMKLSKLNYNDKSIKEVIKDIYSNCYNVLGEE